MSHGGRTWGYRSSLRAHGESSTQARWAATLALLLCQAIGCSSGGTKPELANLDAGLEDQTSADGLADGSAEVSGDASWDVRRDVLPDAVVDVPSDGPLPDGVDAGSDSLSDADIACLPACDGLECGDNGCGGSCGQCGGGAACEEGLCVGTPCEAGKACDDLDPCTFDDTCTDGVCGGTLYTCEDERGCTKDECDGLGDCVFTIMPGFCLINNVCFAGEELRSGNECEECIPATSKTEWSKDDTNVCSDNNACTVGDHCDDGVCNPGTDSLICDDPGICKSVVCQAALGCVVGDASGECDDGNPCTVGDACSGGLCAAGTLTKECSDGNPCTLDGCDPALDCTHENTPGPCNDGDGCTENDFCENGICKGGTLKEACNDGNLCTTDSCISGGQCLSQWNTLPCNDGNECTENDVCSKGQCGGIVRECNDNNICTNDFCSPLQPGGCYYVDNDLGCNDQDPCTLGDTCGGGKCLAGLGQPNCNDNNECTEDFCVPGSGCSHKNLVAFCEDGSACTSGDFCANGTCIGGSDICQCQFNSECATFEDGDKCNGTLFCDTSSANPADWQCKVDPLTVKVCSPALDTACSKNRCAPATGLCSPVHEDDGLGCDDGNGCTLNDACLAGSCSGSPCSLIGLYCVNGGCGSQLCTPNTSRCDGKVVKLCNAAGTAESTLATCSVTQYCAMSGGTAFCATQICAPDTTVCQGSKIMQCDSLGSELTELQECLTTDQWCVDGACVNLFLCGGIPCPELTGYTVSCNAKQHCEYTNTDTSGWRAYDIWIYVPAGSFSMGSPDTETGRTASEGPVHTVTFAKGYFISKYEIVVSQYEACKSSSPSTCTAPSAATFNWCSGGVNTSTNGRSNHPQNGLNWQQAGNFCNWVATGGRLSSEAEWEYAATGPTHTKFPWGDSPEPTCANQTAVFTPSGVQAECACGTSNTFPVGSKAQGSSFVGAYDMAGNVHEWTLDWEHASYVGAPVDGSAWTNPTGTNRIARGGGIFSKTPELRTSNRFTYLPTSYATSVGGRCVRPEPATVTYVVWPL